MSDPRSTVVSMQCCYTGDPGSIPEYLSKLPASPYNPVWEGRMWHSDKDDCRSCHHEVPAYLREYSHQVWVSSQVGSLREYSHQGWVSSQVGSLREYSHQVWVNSQVGSLREYSHQVWVNSQVGSLREYSHQVWVNSQVGSLREYSHEGWVSSQVLLAGKLIVANRCK